MEEKYPESDNDVFFEMVNDEMLVRVETPEASPVIQSKPSSPQDNETKLEEARKAFQSMALDGAFDVEKDNAIVSHGPPILPTRALNWGDCTKWATRGFCGRQSCGYNHELIIKGRHPSFCSHYNTPKGCKYGNKCTYQHIKLLDRPGTAPLEKSPPHLIKRAVKTASRKDSGKLVDVEVKEFDGRLIDYTIETSLDFDHCTPTFRYLDFKNGAKEDAISRETLIFKDYFWFIDMDNANFIRENSVPYDTYLIITLDRPFKIMYKDFWGASPKWIKHDRHGKCVLYKRNTERLNSNRLTDGLSPHEFSRLVSALQSRRTDRSPQATIMPAIFRSMFREQEAWRSFYYKKYQDKVLQQALDDFKLVDNIKLKMMHAYTKNPILDKVDEVVDAVAGTMKLLPSFKDSFHSALKGVNVSVADYFDKYFHVTESPYPDKDKIIALEADHLGEGVTVDLKPDHKVLQELSFQDPKPVDVEVLLPTVKSVASFPLETTANLKNAVEQRQNKLAPEMTDLGKHLFDRGYREFMIDYCNHPVTEHPDHDEWFQSRNWPKSKKMKYDAMYEGLLNPSAARSIFIKRDLGLVSPEKAARLICCSPGDIQMYYGKYTDCLKKHITKHSRHKQIICAVGYDRQTLGEILHESVDDLTTHYMYADYSRFDSTINATHMKAEKGIYNMFFHALYKAPDSPFTDMIERACKAFKATCLNDNTMLAVIIPPSRATGDPGTTLGNCVVNMMVWYSLLNYKVDNGRLIKSPLKDVKVMICGDDDLMWGPKDSLQELQARIAYVKQMGFVLEASEIVNSYTKVDFLSGFFLRAQKKDSKGNMTKTLVHVPKIGRVIAKAGLSYKAKKNYIVQRYQLIYQKLMGLEANVWFIPDLHKKVQKLMNKCQPELKKICPKWRMKNEEESWIKMGEDSMLPDEDTHTDLLERYEDLSCLTHFEQYLDLDDSQIFVVNKREVELSFPKRALLEDDIYFDILRRDGVTPSSEL